MDIDVNASTEALRKQLDKTLAEINSTNAQIQIVQKSPAIQKWTNEYNQINTELNALRNSKRIDGNKLTKLTQARLKKIREPEIQPLLDLKQNLKQLKEDYATIQAALDEKIKSSQTQTKVNTEPQQASAKTVQQTNSQNSRRISNAEFISCLMELSEIQALNRKRILAQNTKKFTDSLSKLTANVDAKITSAAQQYRQYKDKVQSEQDKFSKAVNALSEQYSQLLTNSEVIIQFYQREYTKQLIQIENQEMNIQFYKKRVPETEYDKKGFLEWESKVKPIDKQMKKLKSLKSMTPKQIAEYNQLAKQRSALYTNDKYKDNPLVKMIKEKEDMIARANSLEKNIQTIERNQSQQVAQLNSDFEQINSNKEQALATIQKRSFSKTIWCSCRQI